MASKKDDPAAARRAKLFGQKLAMIVGDGGNPERTMARLERMLPKAKQVGATIPPEVERFLETYDTPTPAEPAEPAEPPSSDLEPTGTATE